MPLDNVKYASLEWFAVAKLHEWMIKSKISVGSLNNPSKTPKI